MHHPQNPKKEKPEIVMVLAKNHPTLLTNFCDTTHTNWAGVTTDYKGSLVPPEIKEYAFSHMKENNLRGMVMYLLYDRQEKKVLNSFIVSSC